ncbi:MAG: hypothetical protein QXO75_07080 [Nitrososphaerota archaeon]
MNSNINDLRYVFASFTNVSPPNYRISNISIPEFFNLSSRNASLLALFINYLSRNASMISPQAYGNLLSIGTSAYVNITSYRNTTVRPFPLNVNDTENYSKTMLIINYAKNFTVPSSFPSGWSYPPSDNISYHLVTKIVNTYTVTAYVVIKYSISYYLVNEYRTGYASCYGGHIYVYQYYDAKVNYEFYYYLNDNGTTKLYAVVSQSQVIPYSGGEIGPITETTSAPVPGNTTNAQATAGLLFTEQESQQTSSYTQHCKIGNRTIVSRVYVTTYQYRPVLNTVIDISNTYIFYEYNVTLPLQITVLNGTNPTTYIYENSSHVTSSSRVINTNISYLVWSSSPKQYHVSIKTNDSINVGGLQINREWNAGTLQILPKIFLQTLQSGNDYIHNYYLNFNIDSNITEPPFWIDGKMAYDKYAAIDYFYLEQNASLAAALMNYIKSTVNQSDTQFTRFEYFVLAAQFTGAYSSQTELFNNFLELETLGNVSWSLVSANILNLSALPDQKYVQGLLQFYNVSRIPEVYNVSVYANISGNYEVYLNDMYNAQYKLWDNITFGNPYSLGNISFYTFQNTSIPYVGQALYFYNSDYVPEIIYAIFSNSNPPIVKITAIWNGTAWIS